MREVLTIDGENLFVDFVTDLTGRLIRFHIPDNTAESRKQAREAAERLLTKGK